MAFYRCDSCGFEREIPPEYAGKTVGCLKCHHRNMIQRGDRGEQNVVRSDAGRRSWMFAAGVVVLFAMPAAFTLVFWKSASFSNFWARDAVPGAKQSVPVADVRAKSLPEHPAGNRDVSRMETAALGDSGEGHKVQPAEGPTNTRQQAKESAQVGVVPVQPEVNRASPQKSTGTTKTVPAVVPASKDDARLSNQIAQGRELFEHEWTTRDKLAGQGDGLGPVFNARSCVECHFQSGTGGSGTNAHNVESFEVLPVHAGGNVRDGVIHGFALNRAERESRDHLNQALGSPTVPVKSAVPGTPTTIDAVRAVLVNTPALWGNGLIDQIEDRELKELEATRGGRLRILPNGRVGKFGWKGQISSLHEFVGSACANELGLSNSVRLQAAPRLYQEASESTPDLTNGQVKSLETFVANLPAPRQVLPENETDREAVQAGHRLFLSIGCAACHVENVGQVAGVYSDFRLHEVNLPGVQTKIYYTPVEPLYEAPADYPRLAEWKTPPLWGLADTAPYWHDGSAITIEAAILNHAKEGDESRMQFQQLDEFNQKALLAFLNSLKAPSFDN